jgi:hypothetical protein
MVSILIFFEKNVSIIVVILHVKIPVSPVCARFWPDPGQILARIRPDLARSGQIWPDSGQIRPESGQNYFEKFFNAFDP